MQIKEAIENIKSIKAIKVRGAVYSVKGQVIEARGLNKFLSIGSICALKTRANALIKCEVISFTSESALFMPYSLTEGISPGDEMILLEDQNAIYPDESWLGKVIDPFGTELLFTKGKSNFKKGEQGFPLKNDPLLAQSRMKIGGKIDLGVKVIDTFTSCCYGQRMGIFAGSGVGKSVLISMLTKYADTDVKVIGLVGERGREAKEFIEDYLGPEGLKKAVIILATGDELPLMRARAAYATMAVAEYFRDIGKNVLCIIDSITRFAMAQREIGLSIGEPPTSKGYTPSVFSELPKLLERAGPGTGSAHITALFTVLVEGDDQNEPISDAVRGILDGHIVLDRDIAHRGRFPAVNVLKSVSRAMPKCNNDLENEQVKFARRMLSTFTDMEEMIRIGAYKKGSNSEVDNAIHYAAKLEEFLAQAPHEQCPAAESFKKLGEITGITEAKSEFEKQ